MTVFEPQSLSANIAFAQQYPMLLFGAAGFFLVIVAAAFKNVRRQISSWLEIPLPSTHQHLLPLDSFRGIAALWVAVFHGCQWTVPVFASVTATFPFILAGHYGVQAFVILSGMLIYRSLLTVETIDGLRFYFWRRLLRICPLYVATSLILLFLIPGKPSRILSEIFMFQTVGFPYFLNPVAWSVYVEILFYLVMPVFVFMARKKAVIFAVAGFIILALGEEGGTRELSLWKFFLLGVICSETIDLFFLRRSELQKRISGGLFFLAGFSLLAFGVIADIRGGMMGSSERAITVGLGWALAICGAVLEPNLRRFFSFRPLRIIGTISYSIYLIHPLLLICVFKLVFTPNAAQIVTRGYEPLPAGVLAFFLLYIPTLLFLSCCSYLSVERPMLKLRPGNRGGTGGPPSHKNE